MENPFKSSRKKKNHFVHPSSYIDKDVKIGKGTKIWHFSHILERSVIGKNCKVGQNVVIGPDVIIGNNVKIQNNVSIYKGVTLEDNVFCGPSCVFTNVINPRSAIVRMDEIRSTLIKKGATIGANATIVCGRIIGCYAFLGAGTVVVKDVCDYGLILGVPGKLKGYVCECGVRLKFIKSKASCNACGKKYKRNHHSVYLI